MPLLPRIRMSLPDRLVSWLDPVAGARRMRARLGMAAASGHVPGVRRQSGGHDGTLANWRPRREREQLSEDRAYDTTMRRAESLAANDGHAAGAVDALALNVVGTGMQPQSYPDHVALGISEDQAEAFAESMETAWRLWCEEADATGRGCFEDLQYLAARSLFVTGELLHLPVWRDEPGRVFGHALQALHPARLRTPVDIPHAGGVRNGVVPGPCGEPSAYWIADPRPGFPLESLDASHFRLIPRKVGHRWACFHCFHALMPEQDRGVSILSPAMKQFRDLADYVDYELVGAMIAASFTVFLEAPADVMAGAASFDGSPQGAASAYLPLQPGTMTVGQPGHKPHIIASNRPGPTFDAFYERILRAAAASTGQPYEMVAKDFSRTNYSSARAALLEVWKLHTLYQDWMVRCYLRPNWLMVMEEAWLRGLLRVPAGAPSFWRSPAVMRAWGRCIWTRPPRGQVDPVKERQADDLALGSLTETRTGICYARGLDFPTLARQRQREERLLRDLGLVPGPSAPVAPDAPDAPSAPGTRTGDDDDTGDASPETPATTEDPAA